MEKGTTIRLTPENRKGVEAHQGRESINETVNRLIARALTVEQDQAILYRIKELCERSLALSNAVHEPVLEDAEVEKSRQAYLNGIRNEKNA